ncbi:MAG: bifunctional diaminohydroxyphosphoribosylaminopyrimidine deaminase/5-amino-6-(5-phosphoribosylamino)uracil reductase RibD [Acidimicrobiales bacterium]
MTSASNPGPAAGARDEDLAAMRRALALAASVRTRTSPNPWVGAVVVAGAERFEGATAPVGGPHAEVAALEAAGDKARGAILYTSLEPCSHQGRTGPCVDAIVAAGVARVVIGVLDPDTQVAGRGAEALRRAGVSVEVGVCEEEAADVLAPYLTHRGTGRPWVVLKLAATLDGRIAAPDGSSRWITGAEARADVQRLRAESDAVLVGAGTVRADDPELTVRLPELADHQPLRVVLGRAPEGARVHPALELSGDLPAVLDELGGKGVLQLLVEGGATVAHDLHAARLVDRYVIYVTPALFGGDDAVPMFAGPGAPDIDQLWRGRLVSVTRLGDDLRIDLAPPDQPKAA